MTSAGNENAALRQFYEREFACLEAMTFHREMAAVAALYLCVEGNQVPPMWAIQGATELICNLLAREKSNKRGRSAGVVARYRQDLIDFERWDAVYEARRSQKRIRQEVELIRNYPNYPASMRTDREKLLAWFGRSWSRACECAALTLRGRDAYASPHTIRKSYMMLQKHFKGPQQKTRYYPIDEGFLRRLGFKSSHERNRGTKTMPLYNLEL